ncbi:MAG TPA: DMT family transporter [Opitutales bacterium]|jgi:drug/metabolite transporter (DMT)-like permease|nr:DMT family transporter [Opitutales bacterium]
MDHPYFLLQPLLWSFGYAVSSLMLKRALDGGAGPLRIAFLNNIAIGIYFLPGLAMLPHPVDWKLLFWPLVASGVYFVGQLSTFLAMRIGDVTVLTPVLGTKVVFVALFTFMLGAAPMLWTGWLAAILSATAVFLLGLSSWQDRKRLLQTALLGMTSAALYGRCDLIFQVHAHELGALPFAGVMMFAVMLESFLLVPFFREPLRAIPRPAWPWAFWGSLLGAAQSGGMAYTLGVYGQAEAVNVVYSTRGLWSILLVWQVGPWFGNQERAVGGKVMVRRLAGALLLLVAVGLILWGK